MPELRWIPYNPRHFIIVILATLICAFFPFLFCFNFGTDAYKNDFIIFAECSLTTESRLGQAGILVGYVCAILALIPHLYTNRAKQNVKLAPKVINQLQSELSSAKKAAKGNAVKNDSIAKIERDLKLANRHFARAKNFPGLMKNLNIAAFVLFALGTIMQFIETGA